MKQLTLIRHAKSSWSNVSVGDFERPLSARGLRDAPRMGAHLRELPLPPVSRMISSPALRARTTTDLIAKELGLAEERLTLEPRIYGASRVGLFELVRGLDEAEGHVVLVGHNPGFEQLARALDPNFDGDGAKYPTCGVARMQLAVKTWAEVDEGSVESSRFVYPKML